MKTMNPAAVVCPYLVGDLYITERAGNPSQSWPGTTWQQITDCFIRAADSAHPSGSTGGSWTHTQTVEEMAAHRHVLNYWTGLNNGNPGTAGSQEDVLLFNENPAAGDRFTEMSGSGLPMDITNKFRAAYIWKRTG